MICGCLAFARVRAQPGYIYTFAGKNNFAGNGGPATAALILNANGIAISNSGDLYFADSNNGAIRKVFFAFRMFIFISKSQTTIQVTPNGIITAAAGTMGVNGIGGNGGPATNALLNKPSGVAIASTGDIFIADYVNNVVRKVRKEMLLAFRRSQFSTV